MIVAVVLSFTALLPARAADTKSDTKQAWEKHCAKCHGPDGKADTMIGKKLEVRDLTDPKVQSSFTDAKAISSIKEGVKVEGRRKMPGYAEKLNDEQIKALVAFVRGLKKG
jgi:mono/diheme cytochrome c family protein